MTNLFPLLPVFVGETPTGERITLYRQENELILDVPDEGHIRLKKGTEFTSWEHDDRMAVSLRIKSPEWSGVITGTRVMFVELHIPPWVRELYDTIDRDEKETP